MFFGAIDRPRFFSTFAGPPESNVHWETVRITFITHFAAHAEFEIDGPFPRVKVMKSRAAHYSLQLGVCCAGAAFDSPSGAVNESPVCSGFYQQRCAGDTTEDRQGARKRDWESQGTNE